jgi:hypothetical protein
MRAVASVTIVVYVALGSSVLYTNHESPFKTSGDFAGPRSLKLLVASLEVLQLKFATVIAIWKSNLLILSLKLCVSSCRIISHTVTAQGAHAPSAAA